MPGSSVTVSGADFAIVAVAKAIVICSLKIKHRLLWGKSRRIYRECPPHFSASARFRVVCYKIVRNGNECINRKDTKQSSNTLVPPHFFCMFSIDGWTSETKLLPIYDSWDVR